MKISLVTGGAGFIGSHVANHLILSGHYVIILDDLSGGFIENVNPKAVFIEGSITDEKLVNKIFNEYKIDFVFHLAAYAAEGLSHFIKRFNYNNNLIGSINLINEAIINKVKCFVYTSSIAVYGKNQLPMREDMVPIPEDPYGIAKLAVEQELRVSYDMFGLNSIIFRPHNVYGENQNIADRYRNVLGIFMNQLLQGKSLTIFGDGSQSRAFTYIGDVAPVIASSIDVKEAYNEVFNIGDDKVYTVKDLAIIVMKIMEIENEINYLPARNEVLHAFSDHEKVKKYFNNIESTSLSKGVEKMAQWVKKTGARKTEVFRNIEIYEKLPAIWLDI